MSHLPSCGPALLVLGTLLSLGSWTPTAAAQEPVPCMVSADCGPDGLCVELDLSGIDPAELEALSPGKRAYLEQHFCVGAGYQPVVSPLVQVGACQTSSDCGGAPCTLFNAEDFADQGYPESVVEFLLGWGSCGPELPPNDDETEAQEPNVTEPESVGDTEPAPTEPDAAGGSTSESDLGVPISVTEGEQGFPCATDDDCPEPSRCYQEQCRYPVIHCSLSMDTCPDNYPCSLYSTGGDSAIHACLPEETSCEGALPCPPDWNCLNTRGGAAFPGWVGYERTCLPPALAAWKTGKMGEAVYGTSQTVTQLSKPLINTDADSSVRGQSTDDTKAVSEAEETTPLANSPAENKAPRRNEQDSSDTEAESSLQDGPLEPGSSRAGTCGVVASRDAHSRALALLSLMGLAIRLRRRNSKKRKMCAIVRANPREGAWNRPFPKQTK